MYLTTNTKFCELFKNKTKYIHYGKVSGSEV